MNSSFLSEFISAIDIIEWVSNNRLINDKEWKWSYYNTDYGFLKQIYQDPSNRMVVMKSRQAGLSEYGINWLFFNLENHHNTTGLHVFPNAAQARRFGQLRARSDIFVSEKFSPSKTDPDAPNTIQTKYLVDSRSTYILTYLGGTHSKSVDARGTAADFLLLDEMADLPQDDVVAVMESLSASRYGLIRMIGTPTVENDEFSNAYNRSDKHEWAVSCVECGHQQILTIDNIIKDDDGIYYYSCAECKAELDRTNGEWIAQVPDADMRGYHISQLLMTNISAYDILEKKNLYPAAKFHNEVLGIPFSGDVAPITISKLRRCFVDSLPTTYQFKSMGVDWGNTSHYVVLGQSDALSIIDYGVFDSPSVVEHASAAVQLINDSNIDVTVMDSGYGAAQNLSMFQSLPAETAYACFYSTKNASKPFFTTIDTLNGEWLADEYVTYKVSADHLSMYEKVVSLIDKADINILKTPDDSFNEGDSALRDMCNNLCLLRSEVKNVGGFARRKYVSTPAHFASALAFALIGMARLGEVGKPGAGAGSFFAPIVHK